MPVEYRGRISPKLIGPRPERLFVNAIAQGGTRDLNQTLPTDSPTNIEGFVPRETVEACVAAGVREGPPGRWHPLLRVHRGQPALEAQNEISQNFWSSMGHA